MSKTMMLFIMTMIQKACTCHRPVTSTAFLYKQHKFRRPVVPIPFVSDDDDDDADNADEYDDDGTKGVGVTDL